MNERKKHMDNEYRGKTYVIHIIVQSAYQEKKKKKERRIWIMNTGERPMPSTS